MTLEMFMDTPVNDAVTRMKTCTRCNTPKPATPEYFHGRKDAKDGLRSDCRECKNIKRNDYYQRGGRERTRVYMENGGRKKAHKTRHENSPHRCAFNLLRGKVKRRGKRKFLLGEAGTLEAEAYIKYLQTITHCTDCSKEMIWFSEGLNNLDSASFDRIDSDGDYTKENVRIVCMHCNRQKSDLSIKEWVAVLKVRIEEGIIEEVDPRLLEFLCEEEMRYV